MLTADYLVLAFYLLGMFAVGVGLSVKVKNSKDLFTAGEQSPWWAAGLSGFMTMFSAGTFVVWGGLAYRLGIVAVVINLTYGIAAILVGLFLAGRWKRLGVATPAQFIELRYGRAALHFYIWSMMLYRMVGVGVSLYSLAVLVVPLMPLDDSHVFSDPSTGHLSRTWAILIFGTIVVTYTMVGGLWAVLMTDVLQFIVLNLSVLFMVPLILEETGGIRGFIANAPPSFFQPTADDYTWFFMAGWCAIHFFMIGAEWAFAQRYICVPSEKDARKSAFLFGALYLVSPILWLLPPLAWREIHPIPATATPADVNALAEQAYILACRHVLPSGMIGLMIAAMFSATASTVSSQLNVFASVLTEDIYAKRRPSKTDADLLWVGRAFSFVLGAAVIGVAIAVPLLGGAEKVIIAMTSLVVTPLLAPAVWGMLNGTVGQSAVWCTAAVCIGVGSLVEFGWHDRLVASGKALEILTGVVLPIAVLTVISMLSRRRAPGWTRIEESAETALTSRLVSPSMSFDPAPAYLVSASVAACSLTMAVLVLANEEHRGTLAGFATALAVLAALISAAAWWVQRGVTNNPARNHVVSEDR